MQKFLVSLMLSVVALGACTPPSSTPAAKARRVTSKKDLIGGPHALGDIGDYLLENKDARFIIQQEGYSRGFGVFGGGLIDADIVRPVPQNEESLQRGRDNFAEMFPAFFLVAMEPRKIQDKPAIEILPPGDDGSASIKVRGLSNQFLALTEAINNAIVDPEFLEFETVYRLPPSGRVLEMTTTVINTNVQDHSFKNRMFTGSVSLDVPFGDVVLFGAGNHVFAPGDGGFDLRYRLEGRYKEPISLPALPGLVVDYLASKGRDVSYGFFLGTDEPEKNFVVDHSEAYGARAAPGKILVPFFASAFTGVFHTQGPAVLKRKPAVDDGSNKFSFKRYFAVGNGDVASITEEVFRIRNTPHGTLSGRVLDAQTLGVIDEASVIAIDDNGQPISQATPINGLFDMPLVDGHYRVVVTAPGRDPSIPVEVNITNGRNTAIDLRIPPPARLTVRTVDGAGAPVPCKVTVVGRYGEDGMGRDPKQHLFTLALGEEWRGTDLVEDNSDPETRRYIESVFITHDGSVNERIRPGRYDVYVSRGPEYDVAMQTIEVTPGGTASVQATLHRVVDTTGYLSGDFHIHSVKSIDSSLELPPRVTSYAAEGVEIMVSTDHNYVTDYAPTIAQLGLRDWMTSFVGLELTTLEMGHFNGYPLRYDIPPVTHGSFEWSSKTPDEIFNALRSLGELGPEKTIAQVNHPRDTILGYFNQFQWDQETGVASGQTDPVLGINTANYPNFRAENFSYNFDALEILNGKRFEYFHNYVVPNPLPPGPYPEEGITYTPGQILRDADGKIAFPGQVEDWFTLLRMGKKVVAVANSDSHKVKYEEAGYPRTYVAADSDLPTGIGAEKLVGSLKGMDALMTNGPFVRFSVEGAGMGRTVGVREGKVQVTGVVDTAPWVRPSQLTIFVGNREARKLDIPRESRHFEFNESVDITGTDDTFVVVRVNGGDSLFPVVPTFDEPPLLINDAIGAIGGAFGFGGDPYGNIQPPKTFAVTPYALTNPVFVDVDGNGEYDAPGVNGEFVRRRPAMGPQLPSVDIDATFKVQGPRHIWQLIRTPVKGQALDVRRIFQAFDHHH